MPLAHCSIGTATDRINLLDETGIHVGEWTPIAGGVDASFSQSSLADYRRLQYFREVTTEETVEFTVKKSSQDDVIRAMQDLRRMLRLAMDYWVENWQSSPVYLAVQASCESNRRYAVIHSGAVPEDNNPFGQVFVQKANRALMTPVLVLERGPWLETAPGIPTCIEACAPENYYCWPSYLEFGVSGDNVNCGSDASLDDLPIGASSNGFTVEAWVKADGWGLGSSGPGNYGLIVTKYNPPNGWQFYIQETYGLCIYISRATTPAIAYSGVDDFTPDGLWHHVAMIYPYLGLPRLFIDGTEVSSYHTQQAGAGAYNSDAALNLIIGDRHGIIGATWEGDIGWVHLYDEPVWPSFDLRCELPEVKRDSVGIWITEGTGATTYNRANPGTADGTITGADWACDCEQSFGRQCGDLEQCFPAYLTFDALTSYVNAGDYALIQDLPADGNDMIAEAWVLADSYGENSLGMIFWKRNYPTNTDGWFFGVDGVNGGLYGYVNGGPGVDGIAITGPQEWTPDGEWHHVVLAVEDQGASTADLDIAVDGVWTTAYFSQIQKNGNYGNDQTHNLYIGNRANNDRTWDGYIGWARLSDNLRYTPGVNFTPPERCTLPEVDANTAAIWIYEGHGDKTWNLAGGDPASIGDPNMWECDCTIEVDQSTSCLVQPYIVNALKTAGLTHVYFEDNSGPNWSINLQTANLPHLLLPPVPAANDAVYFGCDDTLVNSGPFSNVVFDISTAQTGITAGVWEYYDTVLAAWTAFDVQDNTNADGLMTGVAFDTTDVKSVHWDQDMGGGDWNPEDLTVATGDPTAPVVTAWWVRYRVTAVGTPTPPWQQNRHVYTISWPYIEIQDEDVPGDIAASLMLQMYNESDHDGGVYDPNLYTSRVITGLRSLSRGEDFVAYLNAADEQNPPFITCEVNAAAGASFTLRYIYPTGRNVYANPCPTNWVCRWTIDAAYTWQFFGEYRAFLRMEQDLGTEGDILLSLGMLYGGSGSTFAMTEYIPTPQLDLFTLIDFGRLVVPPTDLVKLSENAEIVFYVFAQNTLGVADISICDLILIPVDEWAGDFTGIPGTYEPLSSDRSMAELEWGGKGRYFYMDSIEHPRYDLRAMSKLRTTDNFAGLAQTIANRPAILQENADQRLWFLTERHAGTKVAHAAMGHSLNVYRQSHYLSMRGNR